MGREGDMIRLKDIRTKIGFSQMEVAKRLDLPISTYNQYETGKNEPSIDTLCKLADFYHCSLDELIGRECDVINLRYLSQEQSSLIKRILNMNELQQLRTTAYVAGLLGE